MEPQASNDPEFGPAAQGKSFRQIRNAERAKKSWKKMNSTQF